MALSARGLRNIDGGVKEIEDEPLKEAVGKKAVKVYMTSMVSALVLTLVFVFIG